MKLCTKRIAVSSYQFGELYEALPLWFWSWSSDFKVEIIMAQQQSRGGHIFLPLSVIPTFCNSIISSLRNKTLYGVFFETPSDIGLIFGMWVNHDELQIKFKFRSAPLIFAEIMGFGLREIVENHSYTDFFSKRLQILGWFLVCELTMMSYRSSLSFVPLRSTNFCRN